MASTKKETSKEVARRAERLELLCKDLVEFKEELLDVLALKVVGDNGDDEEITERIAFEAILKGEEHDDY